MFAEGKTDQGLIERIGGRPSPDPMRELIWIGPSVQFPKVRTRRGEGGLATITQEGPHPGRHGPSRVGPRELGHSGAGSRRPATVRSRPRPAPSTGMRLGRYRLIEPLGRGSQGEVWRALQVEPIVEEVALKLLTPAQAEHPGWRSQFHREAEWGARLRSRSLLPIYEFGNGAGFLFLSMPLVDGDSLAAVIARRRRRLLGFHPPLRHWLDRLPRARFVPAVVAITGRVARAMAVAHAARVVHRDIKPANILVDRVRPNGVYLCDFGLGRDLDDPAPAPSRDRTGTPLYMAPERLLCQPSDEILCDIYSLGVTLAEAVTLVPPFSVPAGLPRSDVARAPRREQPGSPARHGPRAPPALEAIIGRAMSRDPRDRYPSMTSFAEDLERFRVMNRLPAYLPARSAWPAPRGPPARPIFLDRPNRSLIDRGRSTSRPGPVA